MHCLRVPLVFFILGFVAKQSLCQRSRLIPPYFNIAQGRPIEATATCGESPDGKPLREKYCDNSAVAYLKRYYASKISSESSEAQNIETCNFCEKGTETWFPAENAIDGTNRVWMSPPLSRGAAYNEVNLTINLGQEFHVAYVNVKMGNSPRPAVWALERSTDNGKTFQPWQYFAQNQRQCDIFFGKGSYDLDVDSDESVICETTQSNVVPLEDGEIFVRLLENKPSSLTYFSSKPLQEWTKATHIRFRFMRSNILISHIPSLMMNETEILQKYFYSVKGIEIGGRCICNGHAEMCPPSNENSSKLVCLCQHNTCGDNCEICCPGYYRENPENLGEPCIPVHKKAFLPKTV